MIIGITGRGGTGKTTLANSIVKNHSSFVHVEVDKIIEEKLSKSKKLIKRVNDEVGLQYDFDKIRDSFFSTDTESQMIKKIFFEELSSILRKETSDKSKNYVVEHFLLDEYDFFDNCDVRINLVAPREVRQQRVEKRGDMSRELYDSVDNIVNPNKKIRYDLEFNIEDYQKEVISIIVPIYNSESYISQTLDAILSQTYHNLEVILVNDGSTDSTPEILKRYQEKDNRIKVINTPNLNVSNARNTGLKSATGEYVSFIDSDDLINSEFIASLYDAIKLSKADFSHAAISVERENSNGYVSTQEPSLEYVEDPLKAYLTMQTKFAVWGKLFKMDLIKDIGFEKIPCFEDFKYMWEVSKKAKSAVIVSDAVYRYIQRTKTSLTQGVYNSYNKELINHAFKVLKDANGKDESKRFFYGCIFHNVFLYVMSHQNPNFVDNYKEEIFNCLRILDEYKDYKFNIIEFNDINNDEIIRRAKEFVGLDTIGILWNSMNNFTNSAIQIAKKKALISASESIDFSSAEFERFVRMIYPHDVQNKWKTDMKVESMLDKYSSNSIYILYLTLLRAGNVFNQRKQKRMYFGVDEFKDEIRNDFMNVIDNYKFDNIFHMSDDESEYYDMRAIIEEFQQFRSDRVYGRIILDGYDFVKKENNGFREKYTYKDWLFKEIRSNSYEDSCELFCEEFAKIFGINSAFYDYASLNGVDGVVTYNFDKDDTFISAKDLISDVLNDSDINSIMSVNNYEDMQNVLFEYIKKHNIQDYDMNEIMGKMKKVMLFDMIFMQSDRNPNNYGFVVKNGSIDFARIFDNSNAMSCNHIDKSPFDNQPLLTVKGNSTGFMDELESNPTFYEDILEYVDIVEENLEDVFEKMEIKAMAPISDNFKLHVEDTLGQHFKNIRKVYNVGNKQMVLGKKVV